jgi:hypothetical protein
VFWIDSGIHEESPLHVTVLKMPLILFLVNICTPVFINAIFIGHDYRVEDWVVIF